MSSVAGRLAAGAAGGAAGTLAMDLVWYARYRRGGGTQGFADWETAAGTTSYDDAPAPGQVARKLSVAVLGREPSPSSARAMTNVMHWATGVQWGVAGGLAAPLVRRVGPIPGGVGLASVAFGTAYVVLPLLGVYKPIWEYDRKVILQDATAHLVYGITGAIVISAVAPR
ncbi:hypothetical protein GA707_15695 [Nostocoides sp. F2B08]|nr:hypothetical protein GA707_15695 [Tetrasphaera sp. F2B08]